MKDVSLNEKHFQDFHIQTFRKKLDSFEAMGAGELEGAPDLSVTDTFSSTPTGNRHRASSEPAKLESNLENSPIQKAKRVKAQGVQKR